MMIIAQVYACVCVGVHVNYILYLLNCNIVSWNGESDEQQQFYLLVQKSF